VSFDSVVGESTNSCPKGVNADVLIQVGAVIQCNSFELLEVTREFLKFGEATTALLLDPYLDLTDPSTLQLDTLRDDLLLQP
jgi:hypothetical protein